MYVGKDAASVVTSLAMVCALARYVLYRLAPKSVRIPNTVVVSVATPRVFLAVATLLWRALYVVVDGLLT